MGLITGGCRRARQKLGPSGPRAVSPSPRTSDTLPRCAADVAVGSRTVLTTVKRDLRDTPESRHSQCSLACLKRANCRLVQRTKMRFTNRRRAAGPAGTRLAVFPYQTQDPSDAWATVLMAFLLDPRSRGRVSLESAAPDAGPRISPCYLSDPAGCDARALQAGFRVLRRIAATEPLAGILVAEAHDSRTVQSDNDITTFVRATTR
jgi:choline dehydrogenase-like flavoprotein